MKMNKKYILSLLACVAFTACDMDLTPETSISTGESIEVYWTARSTVI